MRVLHVVTDSSWGGAQQIVRSLTINVSSESAVACGPGGRLISELRAQGIPVYIQPDLKSKPDPSSDIVTLWSLIKLVRKWEPDIVHCHSTKAGALGRIASSIVGVPTVFTVHGWGFYNTNFKHMRSILTKGERILSDITDQIVCVSNNDLSEGRERSVLSETQGRVIRNGIPRPDPNENIDLHDQLGIEKDRITVGAVARLSEQKNPIEILKVGGKLQQDGYKITVVLIGDGELKKECQEYAQTQGIEARIPGFRDDAMELLSGLDIFMLTSSFEGLPLTVLEAMHLGIPIVSYDVGGVSEAVIDDETGFIIKNRDTGLFIEAVKSLVANKRLRKNLGKNAETRARKRFTEQRMAEEYQEVYSLQIT